MSNNIDGNSDVGIYTDGENGSIDHNSVTDETTIPDATSSATTSGSGTTV